MARDKLPGRRLAVTMTAPWPPASDSAIHVSVGFDRAGRIKESFARAETPDSDIDLVVDDVGVLVSMLLQHGATLAEIAHSLGRIPGGSPSSVVGLVVDSALRIEAELWGPRLVASAEGAP